MVLDYRAGKDSLTGIAEGKRKTTLSEGNYDRTDEGAAEIKAKSGRKYERVKNIHFCFGLPVPLPSSRLF